ncbi:winged helix-turn-helix transcriptional regulator [Albibacillus kandeliae]|uniref:winged helix-turn-helix transcriptional regulator n=1 Tax=Albibacillus kandeliae TaxID=2174228 RepID=UPI000D69714E|nr:helix-turn-helix domain-containing protein [Albibacillus kandeliae]
MTQTPYPRFCPVAMAADLLEPRWTLLVLCEMWTGSTRFSEIQRGVPGMSPGLLSKRLKDMETKGLIERRDGGVGAHPEYLTTPLADELEPIVRQLGEWAHRNIDSQVSLQCLDARMLMWNIRRKINRSALPIDKCVIQFTLNEQPRTQSNYWLIVKPGIETDLCYIDPGHNVDLFVVSELRALTSAWMGHTSFEYEIGADRIALIGHSGMARDLTKWLIRSSFAQPMRKSA